jgi:integrase
VNAVHAFFDYHATRGVPVAGRLATFSRTPKPHWRRGGRPLRDTRRVVTVPVAKHAPKTLTAEQVQLLLDACRHLRDRFLLAVLYETGMRVGQALGLRHADFVSRERLVRIVPREDNPNGARAKTREEHEVCVSGALVRLYSDYMVDEYGTLENDFVFVNLWGHPLGHAMTRSTVNELTRSLRRRTGIVFTPHVLRHTHATELERLGVPIEVISRRLTHASLSTTVKTYIHIGVEDQRRALEQSGFWAKETPR